MGSPPRKPVSRKTAKTTTKKTVSKKQAASEKKAVAKKKPASAARKAAKAAAKVSPKSRTGQAPVKNEKAKAPPAKPAEVPEFLVDGPSSAPRTLILAHGAGSPMDSPFLETIAKGVAEYGFRVVRFEFPYMRKLRNAKGRKKSAPPDREPVLVERWKAVVKKFGGAKGTIIGGKSLGGRIASLIADDLGVDGLVCLGYPFHPAGKPSETRTGHLAELRTPTLIIQGERDPFGTRDEIRGYPLSWHIQVAYLPDGDHSFKPRKGGEHTEQDNLDEACRLVATFCRRPNLPPAPVFDL
jgi:predicted alpha/beta-hydrolase family hydrolase